MRGPRARRRSWCWPPEKKGEAERGRRGPREPENFGLVCDDFTLPPRRRKPLVSATTDREDKDVVEPSELRVKRSPVERRRNIEHPSPSRTGPWNIERRSASRTGV